MAIKYDIPGRGSLGGASAVAEAARMTPTRVLLKRLFGKYMRPQVGTLAVAILCMLASAASTGALAGLMEPVIDGVFRARDPQMLWAVAAGILITFAVRGASTYGHAVLMNKIGQRIIARVQNEMFAHLMRLDLAFFHATPSGALISRMVNDVMVMRAAMAECLTGIFRSTLTLIFLVGVMFWQDWALATGSFLVFPPAAWFVSRMGSRMRKVSGTTQVELGRFATLLNQTFQGARHVKAYGMEAYEQARVEGFTQRMYKLVHRAFRLSAISSPVTEVLSGLAIVTVLLYGGYQVIEGNRTPGALFSFITAFMLAYEPMKRMGKLNGQLQSGLAAADRVLQLLDTPWTVQERAEAKVLAGRELDIRFDRVTFSYTQERPALSEVSFHVPAGKTVALVGPSGAGKSTVVNLVPRFYDVQSGTVSVGGHDVRDLTFASLRHAIALVSQEVVLFDDSIRANIAYGSPDASDEALVAAAKAAAAHDFIMRLPQGYDTAIGENGVTLSGGQRQRLAIARAMLRDAPILLLDEATSALDTESERAVQDALARLSQGRTTVVIAHRLSTVVDADLIHVMEAGRIVESGTHRDLLALGGLYARLWRLQGGAETLTVRAS